MLVFYGVEPQTVFTLYIMGMIMLEVLTFCARLITFDVAWQFLFYVITCSVFLVNIGFSPRFLSNFIQF